ncbi:Serine/threonine-protein kinase env7 [Tieghemiomyces parasiticus]|uniref:non-specific serine/threonine protein kinase n=1 Tax=Tieghemiomyces parasiticus TaxID=78921 RepID=A0A9W7ZMH9_9FUNG|nr:Serine/threonine-protein kinase env7 [Tieghemiomyces parasiticus]
MDIFQGLMSSMADMTRSAMSQCFPSSPEVLSINGHPYKVLTRLGEGGFSMVYLVRDLSTQEEFAVKKIRCAAGTDAYAWALREVDMYRRFHHSGIIQLRDVHVVKGISGAGSSLIGGSGNSGSGAEQRTAPSSALTSPATTSTIDQTVYMFLPYYRRGNLQDWIQRERLEGDAMDERNLLRLFTQICEAVRAMHEYQPGEDELPELNPQTHPGGGNDHNRASSTLTSSHGNDEVASTTTGQSAEGRGDSRDVSSYVRASDGARIVPYAHRDIKPANVMLKDDGTTPILMDLGSARRARVYIANRQQALQEQDDAAEHCSMPYRAPELFDVPTDTTLDEKVDIWSLGALLYALAYGPSPFECQMNEQGGSIALAVMNGKYAVPANDPYSPAVSQLVKFMLVTDPAQRPTIAEVLAKVQTLS